MIKFIKNKRGDISYISVIITLLISIIIGGLVYAAVTGMITGPVANGIESSFDNAETQKNSIAIKKEENSASSEYLIEDFDSNDGSSPALEDYFKSTVNISFSDPGGTKKCRAEYKTNKSEDGFFLAKYDINSNLSIARLKAFLSQSGIGDYCIRCSLERPDPVNTNVISEIKFNTISETKTITGTVGPTNITFDLSKIASDENLISFVKEISDFEISIKENGSTIASSTVSYYLDNIVIVKK